MNWLNNFQAKSLFKRYIFFLSLFSCFAICILFNNNVYGAVIEELPTDTLPKFIMIRMKSDATKMFLISSTNGYLYKSGDYIKCTDVVKMHDWDNVTKTYKNATNPSANSNLFQFVNYDLLWGVNFPIYTTNLHDVLLVTPSLYVPIFHGDVNYKKYNSGNYEGLLITNPYDTIDYYAPSVEVIAHARIKASGVAISDMFGDVLGTISKNYQNDLVSKVESSSILYVNGSEKQVDKEVVFDKWEFINSDCYYNVTIKVKFQLIEGSNIIKLRSDFFNGPVAKIGGTHLMTDEVIQYSNSITLKFVPFIPTVTTTTNTDGSTVTTTTNPDGTVDTDVIDKDGILIHTDGELIPTEINKDYSGLFGGIQKAIDTIISFIVWPFQAIANIFTTLYNALKIVLQSFGDMIPILKTVFSFFPPEVNAIIIMTFGFLGVGVFLRTFGRS